MSVGNNVIRGPINTEVPVIPVFRFEDAGHVFYGFYRKHKSEYKVSLSDETLKSEANICLMNVSWDDGVLKMKIAEISDLLTTPKVGLYNNVTHDGLKLVVSTSILTPISLISVTTTGDGKQLYSGNWYKMTYRGKQLTIDVWKPTVLSAGFPGTPNLNNAPVVSQYNFEIAFIPFTREMSLWNDGVCNQNLRQQDTFLRFTAWVRARYMNGSHIYEGINCNAQTLTEKSSNCLFTGLTCNNSISYDYCLADEMCGNCLGRCANKGNCVQNPSTKKFNCTAVIQENEVSHIPEVLISEKPVIVSKNLGGETKTQEQPLNTAERHSFFTVGWIILIAVIALVFLFGVFILIKYN